jgi:hypothetical protein
MNIREQVQKILRQSSESFTPSEVDFVVNRIATKLCIDEYVDVSLNPQKASMVREMVENVVEVKRSEKLQVERSRKNQEEATARMEAERLKRNTENTELRRIADIDIVRILGQGFNKGESNVNREEVVQLLGDALNILIYNNKKHSDNQQGSYSQKTYHDNSDFWEDALNQRLLEGMEVCLTNFHLMQWLPSAPGRYYTREAANKRLEAQSHIIQQGRGREYLPLGKQLMFLGGIGSVRLGARTFNSKTVYLLGASSTGSSHQGIPIIIPEEEYRKVIPFMRHGGCLANLEGFLRICPVEDLLIQYDRQIPRYAIFIDNVQAIQPSEKLLVTVGVTFEFKNSPYGDSNKSWSFCSFDPTKDDVRSSAHWLEEYALRHSGRVEILSDFDEHYQHFGNYSIEFPISQIVKGNVDFSNLQRYQGNLGFEVNLHIQRLTMGDNYNVGQAGAVGKYARSDGNTFINSGQKQDLAEAAIEIQNLLKSLEQTNPNATEVEKVAYVNDETTPSFKRRVAGALQAGGETAIDEFILENKYLKVAKAAAKGWLQPGG